MTYNIDSIIGELANGKSEIDIAKELSDMLNKAVAKKKAQDEAARIEKEKKAKQKRSEDIETAAINMLEGVLDYFEAIECNELYDAIMENYDNIIQDFIKLLEQYSSLLPFYGKLYKEVVAPKEEKKKEEPKFTISKANPIGKISFSDIVEPTEEELNKIISKFLREMDTKG